MLDSFHTKDSRLNPGPVLALTGVPGGQDTQINAGFVTGLSQKIDWGSWGTPMKEGSYIPGKREGQIPRGGKSIGKS